MFSFFRKKFQAEVDFSFLKTDMHSHLIAGIDDGAKTIDDSVSMISELSQMGFQKIITTPHIFRDYYPNTPENILSGLAIVKEALKKKNIDIEIEAAAEYYMDDYFEQLLKEKTKLLCLGENRILIEFSTFAPPSNAHNIIFQLKTLAYQPILAHPERYIFYEGAFAEFEKIKDYGCFLQVNLLSLAGYYGSKQKQLGIKLIKSGIVDYLGTDLHNNKQLEFLRAIFADKEVYNLLKSHNFKNNTL